MASTTSPKQFLGFDFGTKHIGVAVGQSITESAQALCRLKAKDGVPDWKEIDELVETWKPNALIIGLPLNMDGSDSDMSTRARKFSNRLADRYQLPCHLMDERLSSREVKSKLFEAGKKNTRQEIDSLAAAVILENWMSLQKNSN